MPKYDFDFFVIGAGSAGTRASRIAAGHGARVAVAEDRYLGGTCVNVGCVPKKLLVYAAHFAEDFEDAAGFGWTVGERKHAWRTLIANKNREIARLNGVYKRLIEGAGATLIDGRARLKDRHTVVIGERAYSADKILIATGGWPFVPDFPGREHVITSNDAFFLEELPERIVIVGGGYIAVEFAGIFHGLGAQVTQIHRGPLFLRGFDDDCRTHLADEMRKKGVDLRFNAEVARIDRHGDHLVIGLKDGTALDADLVMHATGRLPSTDGIGLEEVGVKLSHHAVVIDGHWRSSVDNIYAVGDVTDRVNLTPVAIAEGHALADRLFNRSGRAVSYDNIPSTVFSQPSLGTVGLTEAHARVKLGSIDVYRSTFTPMKHTLSGRDEKSLMKLVVERATQKVVGVHMVGPDAGEIVQGFAVALQMGATKADFDRTIGIHPTAAEEFVTMRTPVPETVKEAAE